ncbi:MAG: CBS domain-containing protein [Acidimicrobiia bacterium]
MSLTMALFVVTLAIAGWWTASGLERLRSAAGASIAALDAADQTIDSASQLSSTVLESLDGLTRVGPGLTTSGEEAAVMIDEVSELTGDQLSRSIAAIEASLPAMIEAASVMDDTLRALSFVGVGYDPEVPLDDGLRQLAAGLDGIPEELSAQGESLSRLSDRVVDVTGDLDTVTASIADTRDDLESASLLLDTYRQVVVQARAGVGGGTGGAPQWAAAIPAIRVLVVVATVAGLGMAWTAWRLAAALAPTTPVWAPRRRVHTLSVEEETAMATSIRELMTPDPQTVTSDQALVDAARLMRDHDVGSLIVMKPGGGICGIVTDRDITVKGVAEGMDVTQTPVDEACSHSLQTVGPDASGDEVVALMREHALRRIPVVEGDEPVGIISLGDLAIERDPHSALGDISAAPPNN